jgi:hypothetical protein
MFGEDGIDESGYDCLFIPYNAGEKLFIILNFLYEILSDFFLDGKNFIAAFLQFTERGRSEHFC